MKNHENHDMKIVAERVTISKKDPGYFNNGSFITAFCGALEELAKDRDLKPLDKSFLLLIWAYMGDTKHMKSPNIQVLHVGELYAEELGTKQPNIVKSFKRLEELGYIKRNKKSREMEILINPSAAYNGKTKDYSKTWNQLAIDFGLSERKEKNLSRETEGQDWNSSVELELEKKTMKQHNIGGGVDEIEYY